VLDLRSTRIEMFHEHSELSRILATTKRAVGTFSTAGLTVKRSRGSVCLFVKIHSLCPSQISKS